MEVNNQQNIGKSESEKQAGKLLGENLHLTWCELVNKKFYLAGRSFGLAKKVVSNFHRTINGNNDTMVGYIMKGVQ